MAHLASFLAPSEVFPLRESLGSQKRHLSVAFVPGILPVLHTLIDLTLVLLSGRTAIAAEDASFCRCRLAGQQHSSAGNCPGRHHGL